MPILIAILPNLLYSAADLLQTQAAPSAVEYLRRHCLETGFPRVQSILLTISNQAASVPIQQVKQHKRADFPRTLSLMLYSRHKVKKVKTLQISQSSILPRLLFFFRVEDYSLDARESEESMAKLVTANSTVIPGTVAPVSFIDPSKNIEVESNESMGQLVTPSSTAVLETVAPVSFINPSNIDIMNGIMGWFLRGEKRL
jgi:hypothetical protein